MIKLAIYGSQVLSKYASATHDNVGVISSVISCSPFVLSQERNDVDTKSLHLNSTPISRKVLDEFENKTLDVFRDDDIEYLLIDYYDFRLCIQQYMCMGKTYNHTSLGVYRETYSKIHAFLSANSSGNLSEHIDNPLDYSDSELESFLNDFVSILKTYVPIEKMILVESSYVSHSYDGHRLLANKNIQQNSISNAFYNKVFSILRKQISNVILQPRSLYNLSTSKNTEFTFPPAYYKYVDECVCNISKGVDNTDIFEKYSLVFEDQVKDIFYPRMISRSKQLSRGRSLVLIGDDHDNEKLTSGGLHFESLVQCNYSTAEADIKRTLKKYENKSSSFFFVVPWVYSNCTIEEVLFALGYAKDRDYYIFYPETTVIRNFLGYYHDVFNNDVSSGICIDVELIGSSSKIHIKESRLRINGLFISVRNSCLVDIGSVSTDKLKIIMYDSSKLVVGDGTTFADNCYVRATFFSSISIGLDCMFSTGVVIFCGDSHGIFDLKTGKNINYCDHSKMRIVIKNHVWVGYQAFILTKSCLSNSDIVGARTLTNKTYPNNCVIAGSPGKVIRKDVAWSRNPLIQDIMDVPLQEYNMYTQEGGDDE
ncbi:acyltransferase [Methanomethylophilus alvi]|uniref:acyltransferase n=1 Tax=Methanomethylophilus alvi TaxID=1291540 RepID=UPI0037DCDFDD